MENETSPAPVHRIVGQLRELLDRGTNGPWEVYARTWRCNGKQVDEWHIRTTWVHGQLRDKAGVLARSLHASDDEKDRHGVWLSKDDAALIVSAVNAMPALLAIAEAAELLTKESFVDDFGHWGVTDESYEALVSALSLLPNTAMCRSPAADPGDRPVGDGGDPQR